MKTSRMFCAAVLLAGALSLPGCLCFLSGGSVFFPDAALESAVRASLGQPFGCLSEESLLQVREIQAAGLNIRDLRGLENCKNLTTLNLRANRITSITPLTGLTNLTWLDLGDNIITNIEPLSGLFFLQYLDLFGEDNDVRNFAPLVANAQAGGLGDGDVVTLSSEWTIDSEGNLFPDFQDEYIALTEAGVNVIFAQSDGSTVEF